MFATGKIQKAGVFFELMSGMVAFFDDAISVGFDCDDGDVVVDGGLKHEDL